MPTYAITEKGISRWERIDPIVQTGRESFDTFNEHLILNPLVKEGYQTFNFPAATSHARAIEKLIRLGRIQVVEDTFEDEEDPRFSWPDYGPRASQRAILRQAQVDGSFRESQ